MTQLDPEPLKLFSRRWGGSIGKVTKKGSRTVWRWYASAGIAEKALCDLAPYLVVKRHAAEAALRFRRCTPRGVSTARYVEAEAAFRSVLDAAKRAEYQKCDVRTVDNHAYV